MWFCYFRLDVEALWVILKAERIIRETSLTLLCPSNRIQWKIAVLCIPH